MSSSIHGHEIIRMVHESETPLTRDALARQAAARFGEDARFHACAGGDWTFDQLIEFLNARGKVVEVDGYLQTDIGQMCDHGE